MRVCWCYALKYAVWHEACEHKTHTHVPTRHNCANYLWANVLCVFRWAYFRSVLYCYLSCRRINWWRYVCECVYWNTTSPDIELWNLRMSTERWWWCSVAFVPATVAKNRKPFVFNTCLRLATAYACFCSAFVLDSETWLSDFAVWLGFSIDAY